MIIQDLNENLPEEEEEKPISKKAIIATAAAAAAALVVGCIVTFVVPVSYVSVDANPSIEYSLNLVNKVIGVRAVNEDAQTILSVLKSDGVKGMYISDAMQTTENVLEENDYLSDEKYMLVSITAGNENNAAGIWEKINTGLFASQKEGLTLEIVKADKPDRKMANSLSISTGRYLMMIKDNGGILPTDPTAVAAYKTMSIKELLGIEDEEEPEIEDPEPDFLQDEDTPDITELADEPVLPAEDMTDNSATGNSTYTPSGNTGTTGNGGTSRPWGGQSGSGQTGYGQTDSGQSGTTTDDGSTDSSETGSTDDNTGAAEPENDSDSGSGSDTGNDDSSGSGNESNEKPDTPTESDQSNSGGSEGSAAPEAPADTSPAPSGDSDASASEE